MSQQVSAMKRKSSSRTPSPRVSFTEQHTPRQPTSNSNIINPLTVSPQIPGDWEGFH